MMTRAEHLAWAKQRALERVDAGDINGALGSMTSDLGKHPETADHIGLMLGLMELMAGTIRTPEQMRHHIEGYR